jgi:hypothetical protein
MSCFYRRKTIMAAARVIGMIGLVSVPREVAAAEGRENNAVECRIEVVPSDGFLKLRAIGYSNMPLTGQYAFSTRKSNQAGSGENRQSGDFVLSSGQDQVLATVVLDAASNKDFAATLVLKWSGGSVSCRAP